MIWWPEVAEALRGYATWMDQRQHSEFGGDLFQREVDDAKILAARIDAPPFKAIHLTTADAKYLTTLARGISHEAGLATDPRVSSDVKNEQANRNVIAALFFDAATDIYCSLGDPRLAPLRGWRVLAAGEIERIAPCEARENWLTIVAVPNPSSEPVNRQVPWNRYRVPGHPDRVVFAAGKDVLTPELLQRIANEPRDEPAPDETRDDTVGRV
jgi:hypothetical protein